MVNISDGLGLEGRRFVFNARPLFYANSGELQLITPMRVPARRRLASPR